MTETIPFNGAELLFTDSGCTTYLNSSLRSGNLSQAHSTQIPNPYHSAVACDRIANQYLYTDLGGLYLVYSVE